MTSDGDRCDTVQFVKGEAKQVAPLAYLFEGCGTLRGRRGFDRPQRLAEHIRIVRFDSRNPAPQKSKPGNNGISHRHGLGKPGDLVQRSCAEEKAYPGCAIGEGCHDRFQSNLCHLVDGERQHIGRKPVAVAGERID